MKRCNLYRLIIEHYLSHAEDGTVLDWRGALPCLRGMAVKAAVRDEGLALEHSMLLAGNLTAGRLVAPFRNTRLQAERGYNLVYQVGAGTP